MEELSRKFVELEREFEKMKKLQKEQQQMINDIGAIVFKKKKPKSRLEDSELRKLLNLEEPSPPQEMASGLGPMKQEPFGWKEDEGNQTIYEDCNDQKLLMHKEIDVEKRNDDSYEEEENARKSLLLIRRLYTEAPEYSTKKRPLAICNGYKMRISKVNTKRNVQSWRCTKKFCPATATSEIGDITTLTAIKPHNHL